MKKPTKILIEYDDGSSDYAEGEAAEKILAWYNAGQTMNLLHGAVYSGPQFEERPAKSND